MVVSRLISVSKKLIKPSFPTPSPLKHFNLSLLDQVLGNMYVPLAFFYPKQQQETNGFTSKEPAQISQILETSLSKTLTSYYPFAGRLRDNAFIHCNDMGARFLNVQYDFPMSKVVNLPDTGPEYLSFPKGLTWNYTKDEDCLAVAQLSHFSCGGVSISACISHKLGDACTVCNFMSDWAVATRNLDMKMPPRKLVGSSIFPPNHDVPSTRPMVEVAQTQPTATRRYIFSSSNVKALKAKMEHESGVQNPTKVEVASAVLYKCAMAASRATSGSFKPSVFNQFANLRTRITPPLPQSSVGNIISIMSILTAKEEEMTLASVIRELRKEKEVFMKKDPIKDNELLSALVNFDKQNETPSTASEFDLYWGSSVCHYPMYNVDFGWGRPERALIPSPLKNSFILMDSKCGKGIEAIITLEEQDMDEFHKEKELLEFASPYPIV